VTLAAQFCGGQAFNVDLQGMAGGPGDTFAANGTTGVWNTIELTNALPGFILPAPEVPLTNWAGDLTGVTMQLFMQNGWSVHNTNPGFTGDDAALLTDGWGVPDIPAQITIRHLFPGLYRATVYGSVGDNNFGTFTDVFGSDISGTMGTQTWKGVYIEGETHVTADVDASDGDIQFGWAAGSFGDNGIVTGFQLEPLFVLPPRIAVTAVETGAVWITSEAVAGATYWLESCTNLLDHTWNSVTGAGATSTAVGASVDLVDTNALEGVERRYYRVLGEIQ